VFIDWSTSVDELLNQCLWTGSPSAVSSLCYLEVVPNKANHTNYLPFYLIVGNTKNTQPIQKYSYKLHCIYNLPFVTCSLRRKLFDMRININMRDLPPCQVLSFIGCLSR